jgi:hypothetical protein
VSVIILLADGARADVLDRLTRDGADGAAAALPALGRLRAEGALHAVSTVFPSVTGPAYAPFLLGRFPGPIGIPGLRWFDRARTRCRWPHARSYVGHQMRHLDGDIDAGAPTLFERAPSRLGALNIIHRGLAPGERLGRGARFVLRAARTHFRGDVRGWIRIDREVAAEVAGHIRRHRPAVAFAAFTGVDKTSHQSGHEHPAVTEALRVVDEAAAEIRHDAERDGRWERTHLWVVSDHGHAPVAHHDDLAELLRGAGHRVIGHPWTLGRWDVAVMVSGNAMAHLYVERGERARPGWPRLAARWEPLAAMLLERASVDLLVLPHGEGRAEIRSRRGRALLEWRAGLHDYRPVTGDPLGVGEQRRLDVTDAHAACAASDYPDALVQLAALAGSARAGDLILSASRGWDFRARWEPIPHVSTHGALLREQMLVPLLTSRPPARAPLRTTDVMPSALAALGLPVPEGLPTL